MVKINVEKKIRGEEENVNKYNLLVLLLLLFFSEKKRKEKKTVKTLKWMW